MGFEFTYKDAPTITKSMRTAIYPSDMKILDLLYVICPGTTSYRLAEKTQVIGLDAYVNGRTVRKVDLK